ncbi:MAG: UDP-N-acetylmuramoyl-tripeptide--D-alanyl-D-alanine ligase [Gaiellaceae bacterium]
MIPVAVDELHRFDLGRLESATELVTGVQIDSRRVQRGDLFVAVGSGGLYLDDARARGAAATLVPDDAFAAMAALGGLVRSRSNARVVGITGSTGKTSTKDILAALLRPHVVVVAAEGGQNNELGLPLTLCRIEPDTEVVVAEMGMRGLGQIAALAALARPDVAIVTGIGPVHLELLGTVARVAEAKAEILFALPPGGVAILPSGAPELEPFIPEGLDVRRFGPERIRSFAVRNGHARVVYDVGVAEFTFTARHQAGNALAALLASEALGVPWPDRPVEVALSPWRTEESELPGGGLLINDAYNANPISMRAALSHLLERAEGRRTVAVLGEMSELGSGAPGFHAEIGRTAADVDVVVGVGELARGYGGSAWAATAEEAVPIVRALVRVGDAVLLKGSRSVGLEVVADALAGAPAP